MIKQGLKFIQGVKDRGADVLQVLKNAGAEIFVAISLVYENDDNLYYVEDAEIKTVRKNSLLGEVLMENCEQLFLPVKFKYDTGDKVEFISGRFQGKIATIKSRFSSHGDAAYDVKLSDMDLNTFCHEGEIQPHLEPRIKTWDDLKGKEIDGYWINNNASVHKIDGTVFGDCSRDVAATEKVAKSMLAMAQISQLFPYYGGMVTDEEWESERILKHIINRFDSKVDTSSTWHYYTYLAFHTAEQRDEFLSNNEQLVKDYLMIEDD